MATPMRLHPLLPDVSSFQLTTEAVFEMGEHIPGTRLSAQNGELSFDVDYYLGYDWDFGIKQEDVEFESDTLFIEGVNATEGHGLGSVATAMALHEGRSQGLRTGRMWIINPRMIGVIENLHRLDIISDRYYQIEMGIEPRLTMATADFDHSPYGISSDVATELLTGIRQEMEKLHSQGGDELAAFGSIDCVIKF